jgi:crotonobetainyl-CoA hydratase
VEEARRIADHIASCPPLVVQATKKIARRAEGLSIEETSAAMATGDFPAYSRAMAAPEFPEGARSFAEGRGSG